MENWESPVERAIREAQERGEFDNLPGTGKPLRSLGDPEREDPDWWVKSLAKREHLDLSGALSPPLALRKEAAGFPASLLDLRTEAGVRAVLEDYNHRVKMDRLRPGVGASIPIWAPLVDVDEQVRQWSAMRAAKASSGELAGPAGPAPPAGSATAPGTSRAGRPGRASWIRRLLGRS
jgi:DnaJ-like protein